MKLKCVTNGNLPFYKTATRLSLRRYERRDIVVILKRFSDGKSRVEFGYKYVTLSHSRSDYLCNLLVKRGVPCKGIRCKFQYSRESITDRLFCMEIEVVI